MRVLISALLLVALTGCTHVRSTQDVSLSGEGTWLVLPLTNRTATPQAGLRAAAIVESVLFRHGVQAVDAYPDSDNDGVLFEASSAGSRDKMKQWVSTRNGNYVVSGVVHEWRYKTGVDGEPAVGVMLEIMSCRRAILSIAAPVHGRDGPATHSVKPGRKSSINCSSR